MHRDEWNRAMLAAVAETLESMAFMEVATASEPAATDDLAWASLLVHDPTPGEFRLVIASPLLRAIGENIYGPTAAISAPQMEDLLSELLNTVVGRFMGKIFPLEALRLGIPVPGQGPCPEAESTALAWHFQAEGLPLSMVASGAPLLLLCPP
ncbi:MAG: hypothetical protein OEV91_07445 [Desulfobulbaceae bacterium]|nr:hypothetical protein [Desulfobulbaceae bacterium]